MVAHPVIHMPLQPDQKSGSITYVALPKFEYHRLEHTARTKDKTFPDDYNSLS